MISLFHKYSNSSVHRTYTIPTLYRRNTALAISVFGGRYV